MINISDTTYITIIQFHMEHKYLEKVIFNIHNQFSPYHYLNSHSSFLYANLCLSFFDSLLNFLLKVESSSFFLILIFWGVTSIISSSLLIFNIYHIINLIPLT